jgi:hypothetical protein
MWRLLLRRDVITAYIEKLLGEQTGSDRIAADEDGDYPVRFGDARYYVRLVGDPDPDVTVFAVALHDVPASAELLTDLNDLNSRLKFARAFHAQDGVLVKADLLGESVDPAGFLTTCEVVGHVASSISTSLAKKYGGRRDIAPTEDEPRIGMYL